MGCVPAASALRPRPPSLPLVPDSLTSDFTCPNSNFLRHSPPISRTRRLVVDFCPPRTTYSLTGAPQCPPRRPRTRYSRVPLCLGASVVAFHSRGQSCLATFEHCQTVRVLATSPKPPPSPKNRTLPTGGRALGNVGNLRPAATFSSAASPQQRQTESWSWTSPGTACRHSGGPGFPPSGAGRSPTCGRPATGRCTSPAPA